MDTVTELIFLTELKKQHPDKEVIVVMDNAPSHRPRILHKIAGLTIIYLPPYSPELNPVERFFEELRKSTANKIFKNLRDIEKTIGQKVKQLSLDTEALRQLIGYPWILKQVRGVN